VSRELKRNCDLRSGKYSSDLAQRKYQIKTQEKALYYRNAKKVETLIRDDYSPEQVHGYLTKERVGCIGPKRIYQHIWKNKKQGGTLYTHLRC